MQRLPRLSVLLTVLAAGAVSAPHAAASAFTVSPIQIDLGGGHRTAVVTVHSDQETPMVIQASVQGWSQPGGVDTLADTSDLIVTPAVFTLGPRGQQVLRVALRSEADRELERDYRLVVEEVPGSMPHDFTGLNIALRMLLPVFVVPAAKAVPNLEFTGEFDPASGELTVAAINTGTAHIQLRGIAARGEGPDAPEWSDPVLKYVLPGSRRTWRWKLAPAASLPAALHIDADSDQGPLSATVRTASPSLQP